MFRNVAYRPTVYKTGVGSMDGRSANSVRFTDYAAQRSPKKLSHTFLHNLLSWYGALHAKVLNFASTPAAGAPSGTQLRYLLSVGEMYS